MQAAAVTSASARRLLRRVVAAFAVALVATGMMLWSIESSVREVRQRAETLVAQQIPELRAIAGLKQSVDARVIQLYQYYETTEGEPYDAACAQIAARLAADIAALRGKGWPEQDLGALGAILAALEKSADAFDAEMRGGRDWDRLREHLAMARKIAGEMNAVLSDWSRRVETDVSDGGRWTLDEVGRLADVQRRFGAVVLILVGFVLFAYYGRLRDADAKEQLAVFPERNPAPVLRVDAAGKVDYANPAAQALARRLGLADVGALFSSEMCDRIIGGHGEAGDSPPAPDAAGAAEFCQFELMLAGRDFEVSAHHLPEVDRYHVYLEDITARKEAERLLIQRALHDDVTGLPNRRSLEERVAELSAPVGTPERFALLQITLDRFGLIAGTYGHDFGDRLLQTVSTWLLGVLAESGERVGLYRFSGASWVVVLLGADAHRATALAERLLGLTRSSLHVDDRDITTPCSVGVTLYPEDGERAGILLRNADAALRAARGTSSGLHFYTESMNREAETWLRTEQGLRQGLAGDEFELFYQPKVNAATRQASGSEALIRWRSEGRLVSPGEFIPVAEDSSLIVPIGDWVLARACRQWMQWRDEGLPPLSVAVNVSAQQFQRPDFPRRVAEVLAETGMPAAYLELEITEAVAAARPEQVIATLEALKRLGVSLAIDDFGTGYSSLSYLTRFPVDTLKVDQSFVRQMIGNPESAAIVRLVISLARELKFNLVAEGVETAAEADLLAEWQCDLLQGYHFAKPMPAADFAAWVRSRQAA